ncbi:alpha/beta hydrolase [Nocardia aurantiaca]|uniref:Esterase family protein n=1 Tax=Nocardia aurantiaca TaxID=2675850 RepID=A0A6I3L6A8_9NOCA|nr:alpha/beta hydrolase-fold protein [Nocardia aurantiaca]MTE15399.1 esterase family protein [Nocardia aurantiaca]
MRVSLLDGWFPWALRIASAILVVLATGWRDRRWRARWLPITAGAAAVGAFGAWVAVPAMLALTEPVPTEAWIWLAVLLFAALTLIVGWRGNRWWRRGVALLAIMLTTATSVNAVNAAIGYYPTLRDAWRTISHAPMPAAVDLSQLGAVPPTTSTGRLVAVAIPDTLSHFRHRREFVYLPPAWFHRPRPQLPVLELIGGVFAAPDDWIRAGHAIETADAYAHQHSGLAPILAFTDATGHVTTDTECVNGTAGNAEDHLVKDIPAYIVSTFDAKPSPRDWGVLGWSMGGTCAVDLVVEHPDTFYHFVDISGDLGPNLGSKQRTISKLFNGDAAAWAAHDTLTVLAHHGPYHDVTGLFVCGTAEPAHIRHASQLSTATRRAGIPTELTILPGDHTWKFAAQAFAVALPRLVDQIRSGP